MMNSFNGDIQYEIKKLKNELLKLVSSNSEDTFETDTEEYSKYIINVSKLQGKIEALEYSLKVFSRYN